MLRATIDVNGNVVDRIEIVRDKDCPGRMRNYTVRPRGAKWAFRIEDFDSDRGAWELVREALDWMRAKPNRFPY